MAKDKATARGGGKDKTGRVHGYRVGVYSTTGAPPEATVVALAPSVQELIEADAINPADARVSGGPRVWAVIGQLRLNDGDMVATAADYGLSMEAVQAALVYYWRHQAIIDGRLAEHAAFFAPTSS